MTTMLRELASRLEAADFQREIALGDVYRALANSVLNFGDKREDSTHPIVVVALNGEYADVCIRTSKIKRNKKAGVLHYAQPEMGLDRQGVFLTKPFGRRTIHIRHLRQNTFLYNIGLGYLLLLWLSIWFTKSRRVISKSSRRDHNPKRFPTREPSLISQGEPCNLPTRPEAVPVA